ncbi:Phosphoglucan, water dikinase, chloroplastic [Tetrabaena socialis]|uniref:Phosphoglucan, water dikinase, chloroplastic n=1 Tax=Tetrabaena socialis TaxID=47790 RepID=A0A2J8A1X9_9CHLO|nr:Phosphoglucan, water dikinase, chloroplastic [Tetrabaena socialis]|eukprot:PNH06514.1 Phosphoglucan, water dikinase, chloroplastic [Tetrabaena socialis]
MRSIKSGPAPSQRQALRRRSAVLQQSWTRSGLPVVQASDGLGSGIHGLPVDPPLPLQAASATVPVTISMKCKVEFGESMRLVGNQSFLGSWDPKKGAEMKWSEGNVWQAETKVAVGSEMDFKVVKFKQDSGEAVWEDGDNRKFKLMVHVGSRTGLNELLEGTMSTLDDAHGSAVRQALTCKQRVEEAGTGASLEDLQNLLTAATQARSFYAAGLVAGLRNDVTDEVLSMRQRWRLADIRLEEYCFVVLSRMIGVMEAQSGAKSRTAHRAADDEEDIASAPESGTR